jgi:hypothetical protein
MISLLVIRLAIFSVGNDAQGLDHKWKVFKGRFQCSAEFELAPHASDETNISSKYEVDKKASIMPAYKPEIVSQLDFKTVKI